MRDARKITAAFAALAVLWISPVVADQAGPDVLWQIGKENGGYGEFSRQPAAQILPFYAAQYMDGFDLYVGKKSIHQAFPGIQAGPEADWSRGRAYPLRVKFVLKEPSPQGYALTVGLAGASVAGDGRLELKIGEESNERVVKRGTEEKILTWNLQGEKSTLTFFIPANLLKPGKNELTLTLTEGAWIVYDFIRLEAASGPEKTRIRDFELEAPPFLAERNGETGHLALARFVALGFPADVTVETTLGEETFEKTVRVEPGLGEIEVFLTDRNPIAPVKVVLKRDGEVLAQGKTELQPVPKITFHIMPHSHLDIGYPDIQPNVLLGQRVYLEKALELIEGGKGAPMTWMVEASWPAYNLLNDIGPYEAYGRWSADAPLFGATEAGFWKGVNQAIDAAPAARVTSSAPRIHELNERRAVDGSPMGWQTVGPAKGSWIRLDFDRPRRLQALSLRAGRETGNAIQKARATFENVRGAKTEVMVGPLDDGRGRFVTPLNGDEVSSILLEILEARENESPTSIMEIEAWEAVDPQVTRDRLKKAVRDGRIEITGLYLNFLTGMIPTEWLARSMLRSQAAAEYMGVDLKTAAITDVPAYSFALPDILSDAGIHYLYPAQNTDRAFTSVEGMPRAFYWTGPGGGKILVFRSFKSYMEGWDLGLARSADMVEDRMAVFLKTLQGEKYPFGLVPLRALGDQTDDGPVPELLPQVVEEWNRRWAWPKLEISTPARFFPEFENRHGASLETLRGDWTGFWEDGAASSARETAIVRRAHHDLLFDSAFGAVKRLLMGGVFAFEGEMKKAEEGIYLYDEHTWGAASSVRDPDSPETLNQWALKQKPAEEAGEIAARLVSDLAPLAEEFAPKPARGGRIVAVMNDAGRDRETPVRFSLGVSDGKTYAVYDAATGEEVPSAMETGDGGERILAWIARAPALGMSFYEIVAAGAEPTAPPSANAAEAGPKLTLETDFYKAEIDRASGRVESVLDKETGEELVDGGGRFSMNEFLYVKEFDHSRPVRLENASVDRGVENALYVEAVVRGTAPRFPKVEQTVRIQRKEKRIDFINRLTKEETFEKEALHFAFPMRSPKGRLRLEMTGGMMTVEKEQLSGASRDWICMQDAAAAVGPESSVLLALPDAPLVVPEQIRIMNFQRKLPMKNTTLFSFAMNNYWHTNYRAGQGGDFTFRYSLTSRKGPATDAEIARFGEDAAAPMKAVEARNPKGGGAAVSFAGGLPDGVRLLGVKKAEDGKGLTLRLQEIEGKETEFSINFHPSLAIENAARSNVLEKIGAPLEVNPTKEGTAVKVSIGPRELSTLRVW